MTDILTPDELVRLAEYCGLNPIHVAVVTVRSGEVWQPDLNANQRDEVVEALRAKGWWVSVRSLQPLYVAYAQRHDSKRDWLSALAYNESTPNIETETPGLAVCRAALKVIGGG